ncbi:MAG: hypothetical protein CL902_03330 [Dehalococcoidia bacterium]|nr:hypothetical protein [Dehalococcoidia bacterium]MDP7637193.1 hypothetical protein [Phycisphaerae bacterium]
MPTNTGIGLSAIGAINEILESIGEFPVSGGTDGNTIPSASSDTTSIARRAEDFLKRETRRIQSLGWPETTIRTKSYTASTSGGSTVSLSTDRTLSVRGTGPDAHRSFGIVGENLYDANAGSTTILPTDQTGAGSAKVYLTISQEVSGDWPENFEMCSPRLKDVIVSHTKMIFQRRMLGNSWADPALQQEYILAELQANRNTPDIDMQPFNISPIAPALSGDKNGGQKGGE